MTISVQNLSKKFGAFTALDDVSLHFPQGELSALLGPSGCGKTSLLRIIAGLEFPDQGQILFNGEDASKRHVRERQVGFVFQHYALFKHMNIFENVAFGLRVKPRNVRPSEQQIQEKVHQLLELVQLDFLAQQFPSQLSGGQRQRIALARALAVEPQVLLLDEPFGALDAKVRKELRRWLRRLHDELHVTSIFVTHDQEEALDVADQIVIMNQGRVEQIGTPNQVYQHPASPFVYGFLGNVNILHGHIHQGILHTGHVQLALPEHQETQNTVGTAYIRPHDIEIQTDHKNIADTFAIPAQLKRIHGIGPYAQLDLHLENGHQIIEAIIPSERALQQNLHIDQKVFLHPKRVQVFLTELSHSVLRP